MKAKKKHQSSGSDVDYVEYDNDNMSPLYSNWDQVIIDCSVVILFFLKRKFLIKLFMIFRKPKSIYYRYNITLLNKPNYREAIIWAIH